MTATWRAGRASARDARAGLKAIAAELWSATTACSSSSGPRRRRRLPAPRLLGAYEPVLLGWCSREFLVGAHRLVFTVNGLFRPFALVGGRAVATWRHDRQEIQIEPLGELAAGDAAALDAGRARGAVLPRPA